MKLSQMGLPNLEGRGRPLPSRSRTQRREARLPRSYARLDSRSFADTHMARDGRTDARRTSPRRQKMKAAVFAALATTAAAFAPVARPLATAAATKLSVVPETVAELPSMLTVRTVWKSTKESGLDPSRMRRRLKLDVHTGAADADRAPGGRALLHEPLLHRLLRALVHPRLAGARGAAPELDRGVGWCACIYGVGGWLERSSCRINLILHVNRADGVEGGTSTPGATSRAIDNIKQREGFLSPRHDAQASGSPQSLSVLSSDPETTRRPSGEIATLKTYDEARLSQKYIGRRNALCQSALSASPRIYRSPRPRP